MPLFMMHVFYNMFKQTSLSVKMEIAVGQVEWLPLALCLQADLQRRWWILQISYGGCFLHVACCTLTFQQISFLVRGKAPSQKQNQLSWTTAAQRKGTSMVHSLSSLWAVAAMTQEIFSRTGHWLPAWGTAAAPIAPGKHNHESIISHHNLKSFWYRVGIPYQSVYET